MITNFLTSKKTLVASAIVGEIIQTLWILVLVCRTLGRRIKRYRKLVRIS